MLARRPADQKPKLILRIKHSLKIYLSKAFKLAASNPKIRSKAGQFLVKHPKLKAKIKKIAWGMQNEAKDIRSIATPTTLLCNQESIAKKSGVNKDQKSPLESYFY
ncbi:hypothetical protein D9M73_193960 [compost metagenome]